MLSAGARPSEVADLLTATASNNGSWDRTSGFGLVDAVLPFTAQPHNDEGCRAEFLKSTGIASRRKRINAKGCKSHAALATIEAFVDAIVAACFRVAKKEDGEALTVGLVWNSY